MFGGVLDARRDVHRQHQPQIAHRVAVIAVRRPSWLLRIVAHDGAFLMPVERLRCSVDVENPRLAQKRSRRVIEMSLQPSLAGLFVDLIETTPHRVLTNHLRHPQQRWIYCVATHRRRVRVAPMSGHYRQKNRAEDIALFWRIRTRIMQRAIRHHAIEQSALFDKLRRPTNYAE
jgi:hypothetical protein